jgi:Tfp pilus assembly protein PilP
MMNAKRQLAILLVAACAAWSQAGAQAPAQGAAGAQSKAPAAEKAAPPAPSKPASPGGKRDPFVSLAVVRAQAVVGCTGAGKRCLVIDQIQLKGVVKTASGMIAMVENPAKKAYFLRENDPVFNGYVLKITGDSVVFKESSTDNQGRTTTRDVVKRMSAPAV